ncbi:hypothetical protein DL96DRAFT_1685732 [Flagelloscypha sp. PMI_526]|nr:hypothetical protein DL96DRAFT_1685732 [Flagelloscypha sp. PMI_526]
MHFPRFSFHSKSNEQTDEEKLTGTTSTIQYPDESRQPDTFTNIPNYIAENYIRRAWRYAWSRGSPIKTALLTALLTLPTIVFLPILTILSNATFQIPRFLVKRPLLFFLILLAEVTFPTLCSVVGYLILHKTQGGESYPMNLVGPYTALSSLQGVLYYVLLGVHIPLRHSSIAMDEVYLWTCILLTLAWLFGLGQVIAFGIFVKGAGLWSSNSGMQMHTALEAYFVGLGIGLGVVLAFLGLGSSGGGDDG